MSVERSSSEPERGEIERVYTDLKKLATHHALFDTLEEEIQTIEPEFSRFGIDIENVDFEIALEEVNRIIGSVYTARFREGGVFDPFIEVGFSLRAAGRLLYNSFGQAPKDFHFPAAYFRRENVPIETRFGVFPQTFTVGEGKVYRVDQAFFINSSLEAVTYEHFIQSRDESGEWSHALPLVDLLVPSQSNYYAITSEELAGIDHDISRIRSGEYIFPGGSNS